MNIQNVHEGISGYVHVILQVGGVWIPLQILVVQWGWTLSTLAVRKWEWSIGERPLTAWKWLVCATWPALNGMVGIWRHEG
jgi:hypothetical protein